MSQEFHAVSYYCKSLQRSAGEDHQAAIPNGTAVGNCSVVVPSDPLHMSVDGQLSAVNDQVLVIDATASDADGNGGEGSSSEASTGVLLPCTDIATTEKVMTFFRRHGQLQY